MCEEVVVVYCAGMEALDQQSGMKRIASTSSMAGIGLSNYGSIYNNVWKVLQLLSSDPSPLVADMAKRLVSRVKQKVRELVHRQGGLVSAVTFVVTVLLAERVLNSTDVKAISCGSLLMIRIIAWLITIVVMPAIIITLELRISAMAGCR